MHLLRVLTTFAVVLVAELPDKSLFASLLLATRYRARWVWLGVSGAFLTHVLIAVTAARLLQLLPELAVEAVVTVLFALGAVLLLLPERSAEPPAEIEDIEDKVGRAGPDARRTTHRWRGAGRLRGGQRPAAAHVSTRWCVTGLLVWHR